MADNIQTQVAQAAQTTTAGKASVVADKNKTAEQYITEAEASRSLSRAGSITEIGFYLETVLDESSSTALSLTATNFATTISLFKFVPTGVQVIRVILSSVVCFKTSRLSGKTTFIWSTS